MIYAELRNGNKIVKLRLKYWHVFEAVFQILLPLTASKMDIREDRLLWAISISGEYCA
jgi:hypothetical protein